MQVIDPTARAFVDCVVQIIDWIVEIVERLRCFEVLDGEQQCIGAPGGNVELAGAAAGHNIDEHKLPDALSRECMSWSARQGLLGAQHHTQGISIDHDPMLEGKLQHLPEELASVAVERRG